MQQADGWIALDCDVGLVPAGAVSRVSVWVEFEEFEAEFDVLECGEMGLGVREAGEG